MEEILSKALSKNREERYQTIGEMLADLRRLKSRMEQYEWLGPRSEQTSQSDAQTITQPGPSLALPAIASFTSKVFSALRHSLRARAISGITLAVLSAGVWMTRQLWTPSPYSPSPQDKRFYEKGLNDQRSYSALHDLGRLAGNRGS